MSGFITFLLLCAIKAVFDLTWGLLRDQSPDITCHSLKQLKVSLSGCMSGYVCTLMFVFEADR